MKQLLIFPKSPCNKTRLLIVLFSFVPGVLTTSAQNEWEPADGPLMTRWAEEVSPQQTLPEYPRPQLARGDWRNLNGLWDYAITQKDASAPAAWEGKILVPFPIESALSGVMRRVGEERRLWYRRAFTVPQTWQGKRVLLHFGAVDWETTVYVNGQEVGAHRGGYDGFSFDVTDALEPSEEQELIVSAWDPTDAGPRARGKQVRDPEGIWYTPVTGIWQTVWLEPVAETSIESTKLVPDIDAGVLNVTANLRGNAEDATIEAVAFDGDQRVAEATGRAGESFSLAVPDAKLWSPGSPHLYDLKLTVKQGSETIDEAASYFGMRKISVTKDADGINRLFLNNEPLFQFGPLDQGWWPDGLYTAPTDEALRYDVEVTRQLGFNMARKHVKVEPDRWYYWCDQLGLLVWQDMPSGFPTQREEDEQEYRPTPEAAQQFELELKRMIAGLENHPSIVMWVPFNEGWGQYDTERITEWIKNYDPTRLVNNASGWTDRNVGDVRDIHAYPGPRAPEIEADRAGVLGEFGGLGLPLAGHTWQDQANWGYRSFETREALTEAYIGLLDKLHPLAGEPGLAAAVYTQTTDVEIEVNGLMTYDRALIKMDADKITAANRKLYTPPPPPPVIKPIVLSSREQGVEWRYTTDQPDERWFAANFDDSSWQTGPGGFGTRNTPGAVVRTEWNTGDIWLRRTFELPADFQLINPHFLLHHDEDAEIYLNGELALKVTGYITEYETFPMNQSALALLRPGANTLAVHCHQTGGGQFIDVGLVNLEPGQNQRRAD